MRHTSLTFTWVKLCKRPDVNSEPTHFLTFMNNGKVFPSLGIMQLPMPWPAPASNWPLASQKYWIPWDLQKPDLLENNPIKIRSNMKSQIIITNIKQIISIDFYLFYWKVQVMNDHHEMVSPTCLIYSLKIPHSNQNPSLFPVAGSASISSKSTQNYFLWICCVRQPH